MFRSGNPALRGAIFEKASSFPQDNPMTIPGTVNKTAFLLLLALLSGSWMWSSPELAQKLMFPAVIAGFVVALITVFKSEKSPITAPIYALLQGVFLGGISAVMEAAYPGVVFQAVGLTFGVLFTLLLAYRARVIRPTENFKLGIIAATGGIALFYLVSIVAGFFGVRFSMIHGAGTVGILFSLFVVTIAALNLILDFDFIEKGAEVGAPSYMEWYAAFGLMVTLVWLYIEILRLLAKLNSRR